ncbi:phage tail protein [candidate division KSB1 bacterium]|nr:phage tail protein [bacterium]NUM68177.1 phage tail protein [candidate division KSB1 bacterium]
MARNDPYRNFRFRLEIDGIDQAGFSEASGFDITVDPIDYREGADPTHVRKLPGLTKFGNVTLKWGVTDSMALHDWHRQIVNGDIQRKNLAIVVQGEDGSDKARWNIVEGWPTKYTPTTLNAKGNEVAIETLEICNEGVIRVS